MKKQNADLYLVFPCKRETKQDEKFPTEQTDFTRALDARVEVEFDDSFGKKLKHISFEKYSKSGDIELVIADGKNVDAFCAETQFENSDLSLFYIAVSNIDSIEFLAHIINRLNCDEIKIKAGEQKIEDWVKRFGLKIIGRAYYIVCTSKLDEKKYLLNIITGETGPDPITKGNDIVKSETIIRNCETNIAQYEGNDIYAAKYGTIHIIDNFDEIRLEKECTLIFVIEIIMFKIAAIQFANEKITQCLINNNINETALRSIFGTFANCICIWDAQHFRYLTALTLANHIEQAFELPAMLRQYNRNRGLFEQMNNAQNTIETRKLNKAVIVLAAIQAAFVIYQIISIIITNQNQY